MNEEITSPAIATLAERLRHGFLVSRNESGLCFLIIRDAKEVRNRVMRAQTFLKEKT